jgi:hypothetical protein
MRKTVGIGTCAVDYHANESRPFETVVVYLPLSGSCTTTTTILVQYIVQYTYTKTIDNKKETRLRFQVINKKDYRIRSPC